MSGRGAHWTRRRFIHATAAGAGVAARAIADTGSSMDQARVETSPLSALSLGEASNLVRNKKASPVDLTKACLERIERLDRQLNAFITVTAETALQEARAAEAEIMGGHWRGPLHGIPIALKDLFDTAGVRTTAGSALFKDRVPTEDAEVVRRLRKAGAVFLGKLNMHEFAFGGSTVISASGPVRNPWATGFSAGGSSAGSAAAVAARLCYAALGSDTGGSIRQPAAYTGIVGLKPTYGRASTRGVVPLAWSLDHVGPMTRTVRDAALVLHEMEGYDPRDPVSLDLPPIGVEPASVRVKGLRIGLPRAYFFEDLDPEVDAAIKTALSVLAGLGASAHDLAIETGNDVSIPVLRAEAYAFHQESVTKTPERYHPETLKRIRAGADTTAPAYISARRRVEELRHGTREIFEKVDVLVTPTAPVPPFRIDDLLGDPDQLRPREIAMLRNTRPFNPLGLPTLSVPCGLTKAGLPIGLQIAGPARGEAVVLGLAHAFEQATEWHRHPPPL